jgi:hypothetical protein
MIRAERRRCQQQQQNDHAQMMQHQSGRLCPDLSKAAQSLQHSACPSATPAPLHTSSSTTILSPSQRQGSVLARASKIACRCEEGVQGVAAHTWGGHRSRLHALLRRLLH